MDSNGYRLARALLAITPLLWSSACGPGDDGGITGPSDEEDPTDTGPPSVTSVSPTDGGTGVGVDADVQVTFSEPVSAASVDEASFTLSGGTTGSVSASGSSAVLDPDGELEYATTYTATVRSSVADAAGNPLGSDHTWSFTTEPEPAPPFSMMVTAEEEWWYDIEWTRTVVGSTIGVETTEFAGTAVLVAEEQVQWRGRSAWRMLRYDIEDVPGEEPFSRGVIYVSEDTEGVSRWVDNASGGEWRRVMSTQRSSFSNNHFLLAGSPRGSTTTMDVSQVTVPAGSYTALRAQVSYTATGPYATEDIFETRTEHYADGVGLVRASWDFDFDDNDPAAWDVFEDGTVELESTGQSSGQIAWDTEPNDGPGELVAQTIAMPGIAEGEVAIADAGTIIDSPDVHPNVDGQKELQDWYRLVVPTGTAIRIDLVYEGYTNGAWNDVDLYVFEEGAGGSVTFAGASTAPEGEDEFLVGTLSAGTYYLAIQAWDTPTGPVEYSLLVR